MQGISKTDKSATFEGITVFEINNFGKIQTTRAYGNPALMLAQLAAFLEVSDAHICCYALN